jgi:ABC-type uncharacterized transport system involved in gliding motility auxiliary subunit
MGLTKLLLAQLRARLASVGTAILILALASLVAWLSLRYPLEADWTSAGRHTLSPASLTLLGKLRGPLEITAYAREEPGLRDLVRRVTDRYRRYKPDISLQFVNPDLAPDEVRSLGVTVDGELVLKYQDRVEHVRSDNEQEFANALQRMLRSSERWLAFVEGHGERSALGKANHDLSLWAQQLKQRGYHFQPVNLAETHAVPDNTSVLVVAGPQVPFLQGEVNIILRYLDQGGNLLWLTDSGATQGLDALAAHLGVSLPAGTVIDTAGQLLGLNDPTIALVTASLYAPHPALKDFTLTTFLPTAGAITPVTGSEWKWSPLLSTGNHTWLETGPLHGAVQKDATDIPGPLTLGAALTRAGPGAQGKATPEQRAVIIADGDFVSNTYVSNSGNLELGLRLISWLGRDENLISIPARTAGDTQLEMNSTLLGSLGVLFFLLLPLGLLVTGISVWWRRSRL